MKVLFTFCFIICFLTASQLSATVYYLDNSASNCSSDTSTYDPLTRNCGAGKHKMFKAIQTAANSVNAGDTVYVRAGKYKAVVFNDVKGTAKAPIVFMTYSGETATLDKHLGGGDGHRVITVRTGGYLTIDGFEITNSDPMIAGEKIFTYDPNDPEDLKIIKIHKAESAIKSSTPSTLTLPHHVTIKNNEIHHLWRMGVVWYGDDLKLLNNRIHHLGAYGTYITGNRQLIKGNHSYKNVAMGIRVGNFSRTLENSVIEKNYLYQNGIGPMYYHQSSNTILRAGDGIVLWGGHKNIFRNNISFNNGVYGVRIHGDTPTNNSILNNTAYNNGSYGFFIHDQEQNILINNIAYKNNMGSSISEQAYIGSDNTHNHNLFNANPYFLDPKNSDFHIQENSPAIDTGIATSEITDDMDRNPRPQGKGYDIGAYEALPKTSTPKGIVDNGDVKTKSSGTWQTSSGGNHYGIDSLFSNVSGATYSWSLTLDKPGIYTASMWWTYFHNRSSEVPVKIYDGNQLVKTITVDQLQNTGKWNELAVITFKTTTAKVTIKSVGQSKTVNADAIKIELSPNSAILPSSPTSLHIIN